MIGSPSRDPVVSLMVFGLLREKDQPMSKDSSAAGTAGFAAALSFHYWRIVP
jgi:hypothetical protein